MRGAAIVCTVLVACGGQGPREPANVVTVRVLGSGVPIAGVPVWFQARDASLVYETETDPLGEASAFVEDGAIVNVLTSYLLDGNPTRQLRTFVETRAGDVLVIDQPAEGVVSRLVHFELPPPTGTEVYSIRTACSLDDVPPSSTLILAGCDDEVAFVITSMSEIGEQLGYLYVPPAAVANDATFDLRAQTFEPFERVPVTLAGFDTRRAVVLEPNLVFDHALIPLSSTNVPLVAGAAAWSAKTCDDVTTAIVATVLDATQSAGFDVVVAWSDEPVGFTLDGAELLPPVGSPHLAADASALVWPAETGADMVDVMLRLEAPQVWRIVGPMTGVALPIPVLPPAIADFQPQPTAFTDFGGKLVRSTAGYDGLRANVMNARAHPLIAGPAGQTIVQPFDR